MNWKRKRLVLLISMLLMTVLFAMPAAAKTTKGKTVKLVATQTYKVTWKKRKGKIKWKSSNKKVAKISSKGKVTAVAPGTCTITATNKGDKYTFKIKVSALKLTRTSVTLVKGRQYRFRFNSGVAATVAKSANTNIVSTDSAGYLTANNVGTTQVTITYKNVTYPTTVKVISFSANNLAAAYSTSVNTSDKYEKRVVLAGSSSLDFWSTAATSFGSYDVVNTAIGGTTVRQWLTYYPKLVTRYNPSAVVVYVGSNDIGNGSTISGEANAAVTIRLLLRMKNASKGVPIYYVSIIPCWARQGAWEKIKISNEMVKEYCDDTANLYYIDLASKFKTSSGKPNASLFLSDNLHPNAAGYQIWKNVVGATVVKKLNSME